MNLLRSVFNGARGIFSLRVSISIEAPEQQPDEHATAEPGMTDAPMLASAHNSSTQAEVTDAQQTSLSLHLQTDEDQSSTHDSCQAAHEHDSELCELLNCLSLLYAQSEPQLPPFESGQPQQDATTESAAIRPPEGSMHSAVAVPQSAAASQFSEAQQTEPLSSPAQAGPSCGTNAPAKRRKRVSSCALSCLRCREPLISARTLLHDGL